MTQASERLLRELNEIAKDAREDGNHFANEVAHRAINEQLDKRKGKK